MRRRLRFAARPAVLVLLLVAVFSVRLCEGFSTAHFGRSVEHPAQYLEAGIFAAAEGSKKQGLGGGRRLWMPQMEGSLQTSVSRLKCPSVATAFTDGGGSLQLCLLLLFCAAVLCCASMSITPWYKSESLVLRKAIVAVSAWAALLADKCGGRQVFQSGYEEGHLDSRKPAQGVQSGGKGKTGCQAQPSKTSKRAGKKKKGRGGGQHGASDSLFPNVTRPLEKTLSTSSAGEASSVMSAETEVDTVASGSREDAPVSLIAPADIQIARLEAEAERQKELRAAKAKRNAQRQAELSQAEAAAQAKAKTASEATVQMLSSGKGKLDKPTPKPPGPQAGAESKTLSIEERRRLAHGKDVGPEPKYGRRERVAKQTQPQSSSEAPAKKIGGTEKQVRQSQVLVVPRKPVSKARPPVRTRERELSDEDKEGLIAPGTPDRANSSQASTFSSPHSSIYSPHHLSRPYAQVARGDLPSTAVPPPPPPPPRISHLPPGAVFAREFVPASLCRAPSPPSLTSSGQSSVALKGQTPFSLSVSTEPPSPASSTAVATSSASPSPFPGMSLHRRLASSSPQSKESGGGGSTTSSAYVFENLKGGLGFPGVFDNIWSSSAVGGWTLVKDQAQPVSLETGVPSEHFNFET